MFLILKGSPKLNSLLFSYTAFPHCAATPSQSPSAGSRRLVCASVPSPPGLARTSAYRRCRPQGESAACPGATPFAGPRTARQSVHTTNHVSLEI